jgi:hypothetical protein
LKFPNRKTIKKHQRKQEETNVPKD